MNSEVRRAVPADARAIARIHSASWRVTYRGILPDAYLSSLSQARLEGRWQVSLGRRSPDTAIVAEAAGRVGGFATIGPARDPNDDDGFVGELFMLYIDPELEGAGLGAALIDSATLSLAAAGHLWMSLWVVGANDRAIQFYERSAFRRDGATRLDPIGGAKTPLLRMGKPLGAAPLVTALP